MEEFENKLIIDGNIFYYIDLKKIISIYPKLKKLPNTLKLLLENSIRNTDKSFHSQIIDSFINKNHEFDIKLIPDRLLLEDLDGIPILCDFASMRDFLKNNNLNETKLTPKIFIDLIVDHSLEVESVSTKYSCNNNLKNEISSNYERYKFLKWASKTFENLNIVPPGFGVGNQINLEYLTTIVCIKEINDKKYIVPEFIAGTDSHITMANAMGVNTINISSIDALALMLGEGISIQIPKVLGVRISGELDDFVNDYDLVMNLTNFLKEKKSSCKFIEFYGEGIKKLSLESRATISNMANEFNADIAYFSVDKQTINYAQKTRDVDVHFIKEYYELQDLINDENENLEYDEILDFDLNLVKSCIVGPKDPYSKVLLDKVASKLESFKRGNILRDNDIVLASINSCLSTANPFLMIQAALLAKNAIENGLDINPNIKASFTPGSKTVEKYLRQLNLLKYFEKLGFNISGYGCGVCYGNSGSLYPTIESEIENYKLNVSSVSSGNRNFSNTLHPLIKSNWLMSPALVIAYSLKGTVNFNIKADVISKDIYLKDIWPTNEQVLEYVQLINFKHFSTSYYSLFTGDSHWLEINEVNDTTYSWNDKSTTIQPFWEIYENQYYDKINFNNGRIVSVLKDNILCENIISFSIPKKDSLTFQYFNELGFHIDNFKNIERMKSNKFLLKKRLFDNENIQNILCSKVGAYSKEIESNNDINFTDCVEIYKKSNVPVILFAGKNFGSSKNSDAVAKVFKLIGVNVLIFESIDEDFRKNLVKMGILPLKLENDSISSLSLTGVEFVNIFAEDLSVNKLIEIEIIQSGIVNKVKVRILFKTINEIIYYKNGGFLSYLLKNVV